MYVMMMTMMMMMMMIHTYIHTYVKFITRSMVEHVARIGGAGCCYRWEVRNGGNGSGMILTGV